jgi:hypothetical protein
MMRLIAALLALLTVWLGTTAAAYASTTTTPIRQEGYTYDTEHLASVNASGTVVDTSAYAQLTGHQPAIEDWATSFEGASMTPLARSVATEAVDDAFRSVDDVMGGLFRPVASLMSEPWLLRASCRPCTTTSPLAACRRSVRFPPFDGHLP